MDFQQCTEKNTSDFKGIVEKMMKNGQLSQEQFNQYAQIANELAKYIK